MIEPTGGRILVDDRDTAAIDSAELRRGIGYVIQHAGLFPHRTIVANIATVPLLLGWDRDEAKRRALELMDRVGLPRSFAGRFPSQLSGGQQQRVGVARALAADPPVMLMDEPFSAVDPVVREQLQDEFLRLQGELGKTIVFVTHDIDEAIKLGDQVAVLRVGGRLAQLAAPADLLARPVDDFVADFVGRDRGYRTLGFRTAAFATTAEPTTRLGASAADARAATTDPWLLVLDDDDRPLGWVERDRLDGPVTREALHRGGTVGSSDGSLRQALDAALSAPSGRGVIVGPDGAFVGTVRPRDLIETIEASAEAERAAASSRPGAAPATVGD
jgi:osmoprotectant transport system ATP-binding protein